MGRGTIYHMASQIELDRPIRLNDPAAGQRADLMKTPTPFGSSLSRYGPYCSRAGQEQDDRRRYELPSPSSGLVLPSCVDQPGRRIFSGRRRDELGLTKLR